jgi:hypothetical protein
MLDGLILPDGKLYRTLSVYVCASDLLGQYTNKTNNETANNVSEQGFILPPERLKFNTP